MKEDAAADRRTVETLLKTLNLTPEERELHKELIEQCLMNERKIAECTDSARHNAQKIHDALRKIHASMALAEAALRKLAEETETALLTNLPVNQFYRE